MHRQRNSEKSSERHRLSDLWGCQTPGSWMGHHPAMNFHHDSYQLNGCRTKVNVKASRSLRWDRTGCRYVTPPITSAGSIGTPLRVSACSTQIPPVLGMCRNRASAWTSRLDIEVASDVEDQEPDVTVLEITLPIRCTGRIVVIGPDPKLIICTKNRSVWTRPHSFRGHTRQACHLESPAENGPCPAPSPCPCDKPSGDATRTARMSPPSSTPSGSPRAPSAAWSAASVRGGRPL